MSDDVVSFLQHEEIQSWGVSERLIAGIWWHHQHGTVPVEFSVLANEYEEAGYSPINRYRECAKLRKNRRTSSSDKGKTFKLSIQALKGLDEELFRVLAYRPPLVSNSLFDSQDFKNTRGYIEKVVQQINLSYDYQLYDCCAVMIRRLLETLIIEVYENLGRADELKNNDGHFLMFSGLLKFMRNDKELNFGRETLIGLDGFKKIADSSAHNRRFNASKKIINDKIDGVTLAVVELRQLAFS